MTELDDELVPEAYDLIDELGKEVTFRTYPSRTQDSGTSEVTLGTPVDYAVKVSPPTRAVRYVAQDGQSIRYGVSSGGRSAQMEVARILLPTGSGTSNALAFTPELNQLVTYDGKTGYIVALDAIYSGDLIAAYQVDLSL